MEQDQDLRTRTSQRPQADDSPLAVSSRRRALDRLRAAVEAGQPGPVLITGEPGAGKTWLVHRLAGRPAAGVAVGARRPDSGDERPRLPALDRPFAGRARVRTASGRHERGCTRPLQDEAPTAGAGCWSSTKPIAAPRSSGTRSRPSSINRVGRAGSRRWSFWATRSWPARSPRASLDGFASSLQTHLHLMPLDLDEARELLGFTGRRRQLPIERVLEELHRDAGAIPAGCFASPRGGRNSRRPSSAIALERQSHVPPIRPAPRPRVRRSQATSDLGRTETREIEQPAPAPRSRPLDMGNARSETPSLIPSKPPIRVEEGLVEVGWDGDLETELGQPRLPRTRPRPSSSADDPSFNEELIEDRYAALQAWTEWTRKSATASRLGERVAIAELRSDRRRRRSRTGRSSSRRD